MAYYKYLDLEWEPTAEKIRKFLKDRPEVIHPKHGAWVLAPRDIVLAVPEIKTMFKPLGINPMIVAFFVTRYKVGTIHIDGTRFPIRINFPILNCENTETKYYKVTGPSRNQTQPNGSYYIEYHPDNCVQIDSFKLTQAVAMKVLEPHQVVSYTDNLPRISCTIAFKEDISHLLED